MKRDAEKRHFEFRNSDLEFFKIMLLDYHMHTKLCKHADGEMYQYIERAIQLGLKEICMTDHMPMPEDYDPRHRMVRKEMDEFYVKWIHQVRSRYTDRITIRFGVEADYYPGTEKYVEEFLQSYPFDFVIGSVHYIKEWGFDNHLFADEFNHRPRRQIYEDYFRLLAESAESNLFDTLGHPDLVKKFGHRPDGDYDDILQSSLERIARTGVCIEVNTSGLRKPVKEIYPSQNILKMARKLNIPLTLGSDSHTPKDVGAGFNLAKQWINECGYTTIHQFINRKRNEISFSS